MFYVTELNIKKACENKITQIGLLILLIIKILTKKVSFVTISRLRNINTIFGQNMITHAILKKGIARYLVEQVVDFHPDMTEDQRDESVQACLNVIALLPGLTVTFIGILVWAIS